MELSRDDLMNMRLSTQTLPIACVEGWSTTQEWTGVPLRELGRLAGVDDPRELFVKSIQDAVLGQVTLNAAQATDPRSLLALQVNGADLSPNHGFPARIIVPALPGVHNTKWVKRLVFRASERCKPSEDYGKSPLRLLMAGRLLIAAYAGCRALQKGPVLAQGKSFLRTILLHDMVLIPVYSAVLLGLLYVIGGRAAREGTPLSRVRLLVLNHVRVPAALSLLALLVFFPVVLGIADGGLMGVSGLSTDPYLARFLFMTLALFAISAALFPLRLLRARRRAAVRRGRSARRGLSARQSQTSSRVGSAAMANPPTTASSSIPGRAATAAIPAAQVGLKTTIVEKDKLGGRCLNYADRQGGPARRRRIQRGQGSGRGGIQLNGAEPTIDFEGTSKHRDKVVNARPAAWLAHEGRQDRRHRGPRRAPERRRRAVATTRRDQGRDPRRRLGGQAALGLEFGERMLDTERAWALRNCRGRWP